MAANRLRRFWRNTNLLPSATELIRLLLPRQRGVAEQARTPTLPVVSAHASVEQRGQPTVPAAPITQRQRTTMRISECLEGVQPEQVRWLWRGRVPLGKLTILDGDPGLGKSLLTLDIAARVSRGVGFPDETPCDAGTVLLLNAEDGVADTVVPRLRAAGADMSKIHTIRAIPQPSGDRLPNIVTDAALIEAEVRRLGGAVLIVIDPLNAYLPPEVNTWNDHQIRRALAPFVAVAERTGAAVVLIRHLNKGDSSKAMYRGGGSIGFVAAARAAFLVAEDTADSSLRVFAAVKMNVAVKPLSLTFRIQVIDEVPRVEWVGVSERTADELLEQPEREGTSALNRAEVFLREVLQGGPTPQRTVEQRAAGRISGRTLKRAKKQLGIISTHDGFGRGSDWIWSLPKEGQQSNTANVAPFDETTEDLDSVIAEAKARTSSKHEPPAEDENSDDE